MNDIFISYKLSHLLLICADRRGNTIFVSLPNQKFTSLESKFNLKLQFYWNDLFTTGFPFQVNFALNNLLSRNQIHISIPLLNHPRTSLSMCLSELLFV